MTAKLLDISVVAPLTLQKCSDFTTFKLSTHIKMKKSIIIILVIIASAATTTNLLAQVPPPPPGHNETGNQTGGNAPIGGGLLWADPPGFSQPVGSKKLTVKVRPGGLVKTRLDEKNDNKSMTLSS